MPAVLIRYSRYWPFGKAHKQQPIRNASQTNSTNSSQYNFPREAGATDPLLSANRADNAAEEVGS
jgi:hypothetical protein